MLYEYALQCQVSLVDVFAFEDEGCRALAAKMHGFAASSLLLKCIDF